ncbi:unnamed protein product [Ambrosiozyma monospora]|uniref:Unnamed protein product n=1 Tax=Ambrosiozyma monospora TaxID=43982 RepID=A0A9W6Z1J5_AMBMO|nr:unnamed protein product [Ambrosiozyma monospora]
MKLNELQAKYLMNLIRTVPAVFSGSSSNESFDEIATDATRANKIISGKVRNPIPVAEQAIDSSPESMSRVSLDLDFNIPILALTLFNDNTASIGQDALSRFSLNDMGIKFEMKRNGDFKSDLHIKSFVVQDIRETKDNRFSYIIPEVSPTDYQFMASAISTRNGDASDFDINLAIDSPKVILAFDYLIALQSYLNVALFQDQSSHVHDHALATIDEVVEEDDDTQTLSPSVTNYSYKVNVVDPSVILLADPHKDDSEAIVFKIGQCILDTKSATSFNVKDVGMFLCKMNTFDTNRLRIIDDFSLNFLMDSRGSTSTHFLSKIEMSVQYLLMRLSLRDIKLALEVFNRASVMYYGNSENTVSATDDVASVEEFGKKLGKYAPSIISSITPSTPNRSRKNSMKPEILVKAENLTVNIEGLRLVLIGDVHELPVLDMEVKPFEFVAKNWSTDLEAHTTIKSLANVFNYSTSLWEPLLDPWSFSLHVSKTASPRESLAIDVVSRDSAEFTLTSRTVALLSNISSLLTEEVELKPRDEDAPYRIVNETGYDLKIWIDDADLEAESRNQLTTLKNNEETLWSFEDWRQVRETLDVDNNLNFIGVEMIDSEYDIIRKVSLKSEGNEVFMLTPALSDGYHNRLNCEIRLGEDKVKNVILKSTITVHNYTETAIQFGAGNYMGTFVVDRQINVPAGGRRAVPIDYVYNGKFSIRPDTTNQIFGWSRSKSLGKAVVIDFDWKSMSQNDMVLECPRSENGRARNYFFRAHAQFDSSEAFNRVYPHMTINISPPLEIHNLLPFDLQWSIFQSGKKRSTELLKKNETCFNHTTDMNSPAVLKVVVIGSKYGMSAPALIIDPLDPDEVSRNLVVESEDGQKLQLGIRYHNDPRSGLKISIYCPYLIVNRTGRDLFMSDGKTTLVSVG